METNGQLHAPAALSSRERAPHTHWSGGALSRSRRCSKEKNIPAGNRTAGRPALSPVYGRGTWSLTLREEHRLRAFENRVLRGIFGPKREEVVGGWR
jgi:hypothetical protein